jgi:hypothetical protein
VPVTSRFCQASRTGTVLKVGDDPVMTFPWVLDTIARARQEEIRIAVAQHQYAQDSCAWSPDRVARRGALGLLRARLFGPRAALRLVPSGPPSRPAARTGK